MATEEEVRARLAPIVDRLIRENSGLVSGFKAEFPTTDSATQWLGYELGQMSKEVLAAAAEGAQAGETGQAALDTYVEQVIVKALKASVRKVDTRSLSESEIYAALNSALARVCGGAQKAT